VIDGNGADPLQADVLIEGDNIVSVRATDIGQVDARHDTEQVVGHGSSSRGVEPTVIDATGCTVMPGLIDAHVHATFGEPMSNDELFFHRDHTLAALICAQNLPKMLRAGVTSIMDPDTLFRMGPSIRDAVEAGITPGPRIATGVTALLTSVGGTAGRLIPDSGSVAYAVVVSTIDEMVTETRRQIKEGADWIKIHATGSIPTHRGELQVWTFNEMRAVCDTAHGLGVPVTAHCRNASSTLDAARAGVDLILHASYFDEAGLEAVIESGAALCPTFTFLANLCDHGDKVGAATNMIDIFRGEIEATASMMHRAHAAGVPILCGSESGFVLTPYGEWHAREMGVLVEEIGLTPLEAIRCATEHGAIAMKRQGALGRVAEGYLADVLVVDGDPSRDVAILCDRSRLLHVISRGRTVDLAPVPERSLVPGERVGMWATEPLRWSEVNS